jgi:transposase-like protein
MAFNFKGAHFPPEVILMGVRWYVAYPLSTRHVEELMEERGVDVDHSTIKPTVSVVSCDNLTPPRRGRVTTPESTRYGQLIWLP